MKVYVVMGNDYPDSVFSEEERAENYVAEKIEQDRLARERKERYTQIHWRWYAFDMR